MEPHGEERQQVLRPSTAQKPRRFRIVKLEERIAPAKNGGTNGACPTHKCTGGCPNTYGLCSYIVACW